MYLKYFVDWGVLCYPHWRFIFCVIGVGTVKNNGVVTAASKVDLYWSSDYLDAEQVSPPRQGRMEAWLGAAFHTARVSQLNLLVLFVLCVFWVDSPRRSGIGHLIGYVLRNAHHCPALTLPAPYWHLYWAKILLVVFLRQVVCNSNGVILKFVVCVKMYYFLYGHPHDSPFFYYVGLLILYLYNTVRRSLHGVGPRLSVRTPVTYLCTAAVTYLFSHLVDSLSSRKDSGWAWMCR